MDPEKRKAVRAELAPHRGSIKDGCALAFVAVLLLAFTGHWVWAFLAAIGSFVAMMLFGALIGRIGPPDSTQYRLFDAVLLMSNLPRERGEGPKPRGIVWIAAGARWLIGTTGGHTAFLSAAGRGKEGRDWLVRNLSSEDSFDRWRAIEVLAKVGDDRVALDLAARLEDPSQPVREAAAVALGHYQTDEAKEALRTIAKTTSDDLLWLAATSSLCALGESLDCDRAQLVRAVNLARSDRKRDRDRLATLLAPFPTSEVGDLLREELAGGYAMYPEVFRELARQASPDGIQILRETIAAGGQAAHSAVLVFGKNPPPELLPDLEALAARSSGPTRSAAVRAIKWIREHSASPGSEEAPKAERSSL